MEGKMIRYVIDFQSFKTVQFFTVFILFDFYI